MSIRGARLTIAGKPLDDPLVKAEASGAWSVTEKLNRAYNGPLCRIRRVSDDSEMDIGIVGGKVDTYALETFLGGSEGRVVRVYDQSGGEGGTVENPNLVGAMLADGAGVEGPYELGGYSVEASSVYSTFYPTIKAFNKTGSSEYDIWLSDGELPVWLSISYPTPVKCVSYEILSRNSASNPRYPKAWTLQGLNSQGQWVDLDTRVETSWDLNTTKEYMVSGVTDSYDTYRLYFTDAISTSEGPLVAIAQWRLFTASGNDLVQSTPALQPMMRLQDLDGSLSMMGGYMTPALHDGRPALKYTVVDGYYNDDISFFNNKAILNEGYVSSIANLSVGTEGKYGTSIPQPTSLMWFGYFEPTVSGIWTFSAPYSNDGNRVWLGSAAIKGYTLQNSILWSYWNGINFVTVDTATIQLTQHKVYPIRIMYGEANTGGGFIFKVTPPGGTETTDLSPYLVSPSFVDWTNGGAGPLDLATPRSSLVMLPGSVEENPNLGAAVLAAGAPAETGPYELDGYMIEASNAYDPVYNPTKAFNKNNKYSSDSWFPGPLGGLPQWISIRYPFKVYLKEYSITSRNRDTAYNPPHTWYIQGSNDGQTWTSIDYRYRSGTGLLGSNQTMMFQVSNGSPSFILYRMLVTEGLNDSGGSITSTFFIAQWRLFSYAGSTEKALARSSLKTQTAGIRVPRSMPIQAVSYDGLVSLISVNRRDLVVNSAKTSVTDRASGQEWNYDGSASLALEDGVPCLDLAAGGLTLSGTGATLGQEYTCIYYWKPIVTNSYYRTLHRNSDDHLVIVQTGTTDLGMYSNRNGAFRDSGYDITPGVWQTLITTNVGDTPTSSTGTGTFYVNDQEVGTVDRVGCGMRLFLLGRSPGGSQNPGHVAVAGVFNRVLSRKEITKVHRLLERWGKGGYDQVVSRSVGDAKTYYVPGGHQNNPALGPLMMFFKVKLVSGVYWIKPPGYSGDPFQVFMDFEHDGRGWILVSKWGGHSKTLDKIFNALAYDTTNGSEILNPTFGSFDTYARLSREQMNALWNVSNHVCRIHFKNSDVTNTSGVYFQRKLLNTAIDFWYAHYNPLVWSDGALSVRDALYGTPPTFGARFAEVTTSPDWTSYTDSADFDPSDNSFTSQDVGIGTWDFDVVVSAPNYGDLTVGRHMGFFGDITDSNQWLFTSNPWESILGYSRFNDNENRQSTVWLRCWSTVLAFHYGLHDGTYGDSSASDAASKGHFFSDTGLVDTPWFGTVSVESHGDQTTYTWKPPSGQPFTADILVVAGGGGGGAGWTGSVVGGAGGGAGGILFSQSVAANTCSIVVGKGGNPGVLSGARGGNGSDSQFDTLVATGGGGGGTRVSDQTGGSGGSGGGGVGEAPGGTGIAGQGYAGGGSINNSPGGGGGAGGVGGDGNRDAPDDASGGPGMEFPQFSRFGEQGWFAGGGGPGQGNFLHSTDRFDGGIGGGGNGAFVNGAGGNGLKHSGGGGGGGPGENSSITTPGAGGSGIVLVRVHA